MCNQAKGTDIVVLPKEIGTKGRLYGLKRKSKAKRHQHNHRAPPTPYNEPIATAFTKAGRKSRPKKAQIVLIAIWPRT